MCLKQKAYYMKEKIREELLDELLKNYSKPEDLTGPDELLTELKKRLINKVLDSEGLASLAKVSILYLCHKTHFGIVPPQHPSL